MSVTFNVQVLQDGQVVARHEFDSETHRTIKIGRLPSAQIKIEDPKVARIHAVIEFAGDEISLVDMGSTTGTAVNGAKVHKVKLANGDQVLIGNALLIIGIGGAQAQVAATANMPAPSMAPVGHPPGMMAGQLPPMAPMGMPHFGGQPAQPLAAVVPAGQPMQPRFDPGSTGNEPIRRITKERLRSAAVESKPHPALPPEEKMARDNRVMEMRVYWGEILLGVHHYLKPKKITIGESKNTDIFLSSEGLPIEAFPLIRYVDDEYLLTFTTQMEGEVEIDGQLLPLQSLRGSAGARKDPDLEGSYFVKLPENARAVVHWGGATFALRFTAPARPVPNPFFKNLDLQYINMLLLSIFFHVATIVTFMVYPYDTESLREDLFDEPDRFAKLVLEQPQETESTKNMLDKLKKKVEQEKQKIEEERPPDKREQLKIDTKEVKKRPQKTEAQKSAEVKQKFTKMFSGSGGGGMGSILGGGGGGTLAGTLSNVIGTTGAGSATAGLAGLGIRGGALTGGGIGTSRGIAGIGTSGRLGGGGMRYGSGVNLGDRKDRNLIGFSTPVVMGALAKEVIQKVIDQHKNQIRYCYEVQLQRKQELAGKVAMKWVIAATGAVAKVLVTETTLNNSAVENCIKEKIKTWQFPAPAGGGIVEVNYPFIFKAS
ncbi:MAG: hypothetical protein A2289_11840 [Deltaproteobacteria bacterium RIFOXYA12_FULL_58_15]|nr:MAG: hypothetical protein A2289_11840 [Deltaproteobacteria bacterium RIFOXYA12_FULL_58_15]